MAIENRIEFSAKWEDKIKGLKSYMIFEISPYDGEMYEEKVEIGCYEDVEHFFKLYFKNDWKELFNDNRNNVWHAEFKGFRFTGKNEEMGGILGLELENRATAYVLFDHEKLEDLNANIVAEIRKIVSR